MNILFVTNNALMYGANMSMLDLAQNLKRRGHNIFIVSNQKGELEKKCAKEGFNYYYHPAFWCTGSVPKTLKEKFRNKIKSYRCLFMTYINSHTLVKYIKTNKIDLIHTNNLCTIDGIVCSHIAKIPHIWHVREFLEEDYAICFLLSDRIMSLFFSWNKQIIYISEAIANKHKSIIGPSCIIHDGISFTANKNISHENNKFIFLFAGVFQENKGIIDAIYAFSSVIKQKSNCELWIAGDTSRNVELKRTLDDIIEKENITQNVKYMGYRNDLESIMPHINCGLVCSRLEGLGRVTVEYMRSRTPVIGADTGGTIEIITDNITGYLYQSGNINDLCKKMLSVMENYNNKEMDELLERAYDFSLNEFSMYTYATKVLDVYNDVLSRSTGKVERRNF